MFDNPPDVLITPSDLITFAKVSKISINLIHIGLLYRILRDVYALIQGLSLRQKQVEPTQVSQSTHAIFLSSSMKMTPHSLATELQTESE